MSTLRRTLLAAIFAGGMVALAAVPAGAGTAQHVSVTGVATCNTTTGVYDVVWTITKTDSASSGTFISSAIMTPPGASIVATVTPNPIPGDGTLPFKSATATATLPGNTVGPVTLAITGPGPVLGGPGTLTVDGSCVIVPAAAVAVAAPSIDFTG